MKKMVVDTHTHTLASGHAYSTLLENCTEASKKGIKLLGMTDHGPAMPGSSHIWHLGNLKVLPRVIYGVEVLRGVEANILNHDGELDVPDRYLANLDLVIASLHDPCITPGSVKDNTKALISAMKNKYVDIIAHPGNPAYPIDIDEVLKAAKEYNILIEINNSSLGVSRPGSCENCSMIASRAVEFGNLIALGSDSHICFTIGEFPKAIKLIEDAGMGEEQVLNVDENRFKEYLKSKGKLKDM